jgi:uracil phosphoribosyltransferase
MEGLTVVDHPLVQHKLTLIRDKNRSTKSFRELLKEIGMLLCYEVTRDLPLTNVEIETPLARMVAPRIAGKKLVFAPVLRAGMTFAEGMLDLVPAARVAHIGLYREPETFVAIEYFFKAPSDLSERLNCGCSYPCYCEYCGRGGGPAERTRGKGDTACLPDQRA